MSTLKLAAAFAVMAAPALATGIQIEIEGEANGTVVIDLFEDVAPAHAERITTLASEGAYDGVVFHRVIEGFMAQTGDVSKGKMGGDMSRAGSGNSSYPDLSQEFSDIPYTRGIVGMARKGHSVDTANAQFFIMFTEYPSLNGQYTVIGEVTEGMDIVDAIKRGKGNGGTVTGQPDVMKKVTVTE